jgi:hypothetical protein
MPADPQAIPGSVRGAVTGDLVSQLKVEVAAGANGLLIVRGTINVNGSYQQLDFNNLPENKTGTVQLSINALCYATQPNRVVWGENE